MFKKMRNHLLMVNMIILSLVMFTSFAVIYVITYSSVQKENENKLNQIPAIGIKNDEKVIDSDTSPTGDNVVTQEFMGLPVNYSNSFVIAVDDDGNIQNILSYMDMPEYVYQKAAEVWGTSSTGTLTLEGRKWQYKASVISSTRTISDDQGNTVSIEEFQNQIAFLDITDSLKSLRELLITFVIVSIIMLLALFAISLYFANRSIKPMEENWNKQKQFVADASHELKTPVSIINANLEVLRSNGSETVDSQLKWIDYISDETGRMGKLIGDLLYLAKSETVKESTLTFDFTAAIEETVASMEAMVYEKGLRLDCSLIPNMIISGDEEKLRQVIFILLDNAVKYTDKNGLIKVSLRKNKNRFEFSVANTATPIPPEDLDKIFDRFYKADKSRSGENDSYGLGLSIAKTIVERSGGEIAVKSSKAETVFTVSLRTS